MSHALNEASEALRELSKIQRELNPVKTALAALLKRETSSSNAQAVSVSLNRIVTRLEDVRRKYTPFASRLSSLMNDELPRLLSHTPLLMEDFSSISNGEKSDKALGSTRVPGGGPAKALPASESTPEGSAPDLLTTLCPPFFPFLLQPENYHFLHNQFRVRVEMVNYLIETNRPGLARHVAQSYRLPIFWFPSLAFNAFPTLQPILGGSTNAARSVEMNHLLSAGTSPVSTFVSTAQSICLEGSLSPGMPPVPRASLPLFPALASPDWILSNCLQAQHSVTEAIYYCESRLWPAIEELDQKLQPLFRPALVRLILEFHATRVMQLYTDNVTRATAKDYAAAHILPKLLYAPASIKGIVDVVMAHAETEDSTAQEHPSHEECQCDHAILGRIRSPEWFQYLSDSFHRVAVVEGSTLLYLYDRQMNGGRNTTVDRSMCVDSAHSSPKLHPSLSPNWLPSSGSSGTLAPDLVVRLVSTGIYLKDEYFERLVLERIACLKRFTHADNLDSKNEIEDASDTASLQADKNEAQDTQREYYFSRVEGLIHNHICNQSGSAAFDTAMMNIIEELLSHALAPASNTLENASCSSVCSTSMLTPEQLLQADEKWSSDIVFIKRPTRFYCVHSGECMDGGTSGTYPIALPNGSIISRAAIREYLTRKNTNMMGVTKAQVLCVPTSSLCNAEDLQRIFVT